MFIFLNVIKLAFAVGFMTFGKLLYNNRLQEDMVIGIGVGVNNTKY